MPTLGDGDYAVRLRDDSAGWRRISDDVRLTPDDPVLDGLTEAEADELVSRQWALVPVEDADGTDDVDDGDPDDTDDEADAADETAETCDVVKTDGEVCGRDLPCPYHTDDTGETEA